MEDKELQRILDKSFRASCRVIFKEEVGALSEFEPFLLRYVDKLSQAKSSLSGKEVFFSSQYKKNAKFLSLEEQKNLREAKIGVNDLTDIDSIFRASEEIAYYCGNKSFGNSQRNEQFDNIFDSSFTYRSHEVMKGEYIACSNLVINCKNLFGCSSAGESTFCISTSEQFRLNRAFECGLMINSSDTYYCYYLKSCQDCMFSFNQISKRNLIGNNSLSQEKYAEMKSNLVAQLVSELKGKKSAPSLIWRNSGD